MTAQKRLTAAELARIEERVAGAGDPFNDRCTPHDVARMLQDLRALLAEVKRLRGARPRRPRPAPGRPRK